MNCRELNIISCPKCRNNMEDLCWIFEYKDLLKDMSKEDVKYYFLKSRHISPPYMEGLKCSYYLFAAVELYYPQHIDCLNKLMLLL